MLKNRHNEAKTFFEVSDFLLTRARPAPVFARSKKTEKAFSSMLLEYYFRILKRSKASFNLLFRWAGSYLSTAAVLCVNIKVTF